MTFLFHVAFSLALITFALGFVLLAKAKKETEAASLLKFGGNVLVIVSILNFLCIGYYGIRYWKEGYFYAPNVISHDPKMMGMMGNMKGMMEEKLKMMMPGEGAKPAESPSSPEDHESHH